ncbi:MAG TPA: LysR substrate-binding domain-containing protein [Aquabacterium sp.]|uniref:LysR substrate-binding domain-containing protein n=1 Tax=Aquabacterium sp. TaxID=1872578 RepID=UPI002E3081F1|nr:LysR substrate-binding domain-containing protein [Aquabacterium sp.]HEX5373436.1 LysR substrate-binding domain-containing protein [Aquabacterium sp.]
MNSRRHVLTPDALEMMDTIERTGSFAAAARELGKVPSALTYSVRQLEDALDVLLFDRRSRQARLTAAGQELLTEGRRLLAQMDAVANRVQRVASGWETQLTIAVDSVISPAPLFDLMQAFYELSPPTRLKLRHEVLSGTWEALSTGHADLAIGVTAGRTAATDVRLDTLGEIEFAFVVSPHHPLAPRPEPLNAAELMSHRIVAVADSTRSLDSLTVGILPGQDVLTLASMPDKLEALRRGLGCGFLPANLVDADLQQGRLVRKRVDQPPRIAAVHYAWRQQGAQPGKALGWWLEQLGSQATRTALLSATHPCA